MARVCLVLLLLASWFLLVSNISFAKDKGPVPAPKSNPKPDVVKPPLLAPPVITTYYDKDKDKKDGEKSYLAPHLVKPPLPPPWLISFHDA